MYIILIIVFKSIALGHFKIYSRHLKFQEGRMRGQAFVTFPSIDLAHRALVRES